MNVRSRAAPAPSGELHVGNVRTFLFNWLFTRNVGGTFVLRIEDTDRQRFTEDAYHAALRDLRWLGLDWDEGPEVGGDYGPYRQSQRLDLHREAAERLLGEGLAYRCFCTPEELEERRRVAMAEKRRPMYDERCWQLGDEERMRKQDEGIASSVRFHVPEEGQLTFADLIVGDVTVAMDDIEDFVILRSDGSPLYQLGVVVDDAHMRITHVIRGDDHRSNTPKQVLLHQALGNTVPVFAHVPQVFGPDGKPLSKRHGSTSVAEFRDRGYLPEALFNYLAFLGWGTAEETIMNKREMIERFDIKDVHASPARFDFQKLEWMNGEYIRMLSDEDLKVRLVPLLGAEGLIEDPIGEEQSELLDALMPLVRTRIRLLPDAVEYVRPVLGEIQLGPAAVEKARKQEGGAEFLEKALDALGGIDVWNVEEIEATLRSIQQDMGLNPRKAFLPIYVSISGSTVSIPIFDALSLIDRKVALARMETLLALLQS